MSLSEKLSILGAQTISTFLSAFESELILEKQNENKAVYAEKITNIILDHINMLKIDTNTITLTDATAGVGGDTISFGKKFHHIKMELIIYEYFYKY